MLSTGTILSPFRPSTCVALAYKTEATRRTYIFARMRKTFQWYMRDSRLSFLLYVSLRALPKGWQLDQDFPIRPFSLCRLYFSFSKEDKDQALSAIFLRSPFRLLQIVHARPMPRHTATRSTWPIVASPTPSSWTCRRTRFTQPEWLTAGETQFSHSKHATWLCTPLFARS
jgi:hypothetical protein